MALNGVLWLLGLVLYLACTHCAMTTEGEQLGSYLTDNGTDSEPQNASNILPGIAGGTSAALGQYPWMVRLKTTFLMSSGECGGTLITKQHVLTAAHCLQKVLFNYQVEIYIGEYNTATFPEDCSQNTCVFNAIENPQRIIRHNYYNPMSLDHDIALLKLRKQAPVLWYIKPISLPPFDIDSPKYDGAPVVIAGWGRDRQGRSPKILQNTVINLIPRNRCIQKYPTVPKTHLCAGSVDKRNVCPGDSGGPLMMVYKNKYYISGITSFGPRAKCGLSDAEFYTSVYKHLNWIKNNIKV